MTTTAILAIIAAVIACAVLVVWTRSKKQKNQSTPITIPGLCNSLGYNRELMDRTSAEEIGNELLRVKLRVWPELLRIYKTGMEYPINTIILDPVWVDPNHRMGIKCVPGPWVVTMNPTWRGGPDDAYNFRNAFAAELHSVIRTQLFGREWHGKPFNNLDRVHMNRAAALWKTL